MACYIVIMQKSKHWLTISIIDMKPWVRHNQLDISFKKIGLYYSAFVWIQSKHIGLRCDPF